MSKTPICQSQALLLEKLLVRTQKVSKPNKPMHENKSMRTKAILKARSLTHL
jgi:hypothetical protein